MYVNQINLLQYIKWLFKHFFLVGVCLVEQIYPSVIKKEQGDY